MDIDRKGIMDMKKIALILTGGTIGSALNDHVISVGENTVYGLVNAYEERYGEKDRFQIFSPFQELSENFTKKQWQQLYDFLYDFPFEAYEGVVIAHGTDTLSYSAALMGMLFSHVSVPVMLIASNYPIGVEGSNGVANLRAAVSFISQKVAPGVFVAYENDRQEVEIHLATRLLPADNVQDQYGSFGGACFGKMDTKQCVFQENGGSHNPSLKTLRQPRKRVFQERILFEKDVLFLMPYPGQNYENVSFSKNVAAVYQYLYHAGTVCMKEENYSFLCLEQRCREKKIPLYVASLKRKNENAYETQADFLQRNVLPMYDISPVAGYMKLVIGMNQKECPVEEWMAQNIFFEEVSL